jgi:DNA mismatch endonuclease, patch repair protein
MPKLEVAKRARRTRATPKAYPFKRVELALMRGRHPTTTLAASTRMSKVRKRNTAPELAVRKVAWSMGLRYMTKNRDLPGSPDLANRSRKWAIFVHGCFWHRHEGCKHSTTPRTNAAFWKAKFLLNTLRDRAAIRSLNRLGYRAIVIWECQSGRHTANLLNRTINSPV